MQQPSRMLRLFAKLFRDRKVIKNCNMNKIILFSRPGLGLGTSEMKEIFEAVKSSGAEWYVNAIFAEMVRKATGLDIPLGRQYSSVTEKLAQDAVMLSYGGDGTLLEAVKLAYDYRMPILGLNYGHLGFLASTPCEDMGNVFSRLLAGDYEIQPRTMLHIQDESGTIRDHPYALNEFTLHRAEINMTYIDVFVGNDKLTTYRGDGLIVSTPTGSTAYSLSVGGPIVAPMCECFVVAPIAPHNLTMRPLVIPDTSVVTLRVNSRAEFCSASIDNRTYRVPSGTEFKLCKAEKPVFLINMQNISFYDTLRNKMMWGLDGWDKGK